MTLEKFIEKHRQALNETVLDFCPRCDLNDFDMPDWVSFNMGLRAWAESEGVNFD